RQHQLGALQPVHIGIGDVQMARDVGEHRRVVALEHTAGELDESQESDDAGQRAQRDACAHAASLLLRPSMRARWKRSPRSRLAISTRSSTPWIEARCARDISSGAKRYTRGQSRWKCRESVACIMTYGTAAAP